MTKYTLEAIAFRYEELSEEAKQKAYLAWLASQDQSLCSDEFRETLSKFEEIFPVKVCDWEVDGYTFRHRFVIAGDDGIESVSGIRLAIYLWNNYARCITKGKYYSKTISTSPFQYISRHSKVITSMEDCPLTGVCWDYEILQPIIDCLTYRKIYNDAEELFQDCLDNFFSAWQGQLEYESSQEFFEEEVEANDWQYNADGSPFSVGDAIVVGVEEIKKEDIA